MYSTIIDFMLLILLAKNEKYIVRKKVDNELLEHRMCAKEREKKKLRNVIGTW